MKYELIAREIFSRFHLAFAVGEFIFAGIAMVYKHRARHFTGGLARKEFQRI